MQLETAMAVRMASTDAGAAAHSASGCRRSVLSVFPSFAECFCDSVTGSN